LGDRRLRRRLVDRVSIPAAMPSRTLCAAVQGDLRPEKALPIEKEIE
jgi:hypothetical protein